jgi:adenosylhomocysteine nucleosidase
MSGSGVCGPNAEFGLVAALEREVAVMVRDWRREIPEAAASKGSIYRRADGRAVLVCAGTGAERAYEAAKALVESYAVKTLVSIGFAGSCVEELRPGAVVVPAKVVEAASGRQHACEFGQGTVVSMRGLASVAAKRDARLRHGALAVEMEAAGVAAAAAKYGIRFAAIKAISDGAEEELDFLAPFVTPEGFATGRFLAHIALRPVLWPRVAGLQHKSKLAAAALERAVAEYVTAGRASAARSS